MASCITVASRFWPLRSSGLRLKLHQSGAPPCWRAGVRDCEVSWERAPCPLHPWTTLMGRRVSSWSLRFVRNMLLRSLDLLSGSTWASLYRPTTRWKLESKDCTALWMSPINKGTTSDFCPNCFVFQNATLWWAHQSRLLKPAVF